MACVGPVPGHAVTMPTYDVKIISKIRSRSQVAAFRGGFIPVRFTAELTGGDITGKVIMQIRLFEDGPHVEAYTLEAPRGDTISSSTQRLPLGRLLDAAVNAAILRQQSPRYRDRP